MAWITLFASSSISLVLYEITKWTLQELKRPWRVLCIFKSERLGWLMDCVIFLKGRHVDLYMVGCKYLFEPKCSLHVWADNPLLYKFKIFNHLKPIKWSAWQFHSYFEQDYLKIDENLTKWMKITKMTSCVCDSCFQIWYELC
jgi:hypothetical protein